MKKAMFLCGFSVASLLFSKSFEFSENLGNIYEYQSAIQEKQPDPIAIRNSGDENFEYDSFGNLIKDKDKTYTYNECGQISQITFNNGKTIELTYDDNMRLSSYGSASFAYNDFNMMSKFKNSSSDAEYFYDSKTGYRSSKIVNGIKYTFDLDDRGRLISQTDTLGNVSEIIWNEELPETLVFNGKSYNFVCNDHGDVVALTNEAGEIVNYYEYDVYGKLLSESEAVPNQIRYAHEYYDSESKLYYLRGRYYNPDIKSFTTPDPAEADARLYAYAGYDPINFIDPSGYIVKEAKGNDGSRMYYVTSEDIYWLLNFMKENLEEQARNFDDQNLWDCITNARNYEGICRLIKTGYNILNSDQLSKFLDSLIKIKKSNGTYDALIIVKKKPVIGSTITCKPTQTIDATSNIDIKTSKIHLKKDLISIFFDYQ